SIFFFPAEGGIRDLIVTGVQTCALPISDWERLGARLPRAAGPWPAPPPRLERPRGIQIRSRLQCRRNWRRRREELPNPASGKPRSEERRVGKEGRTRRKTGLGTNESRAS